MFLPFDPKSSVRPRQTQTETTTQTTQLGSSTVYIALIAIIASIIVVGLSITGLRFIRSRHPNPKFLPTSYLKKKWSNWHVSSYSRGNYQSAHADESGSARTGRNGRSPQARIDRNTSMRSVMTLPAYKANARDGEQVLGREGERDGIDVVLEMRSAEEDEELRNAEMEQLYQIRQLRRDWNSQREERREQRREARARGDVATLQRLREQAVAAQDNNELDELRGMLTDIKSERDARASVVNYAAVGVARHDGTRIKPKSTESEQVGLLSDAETMGETAGAGGVAVPTGRNRASSLMTWSTGGSGGGQGHHRRRSSALSVDTTELASTPGVTRSRANSAATSRDASSSASRRGSEAPAVTEVDLGDEMPPQSPPGYEDAASDRGGGDPTPSEPPPGYVSRQSSRAALTNTNAGLGISMGEDDRRNSRGVGGVPQLPSLRLARLPQIVVQQHSANP